MSRRLLPALVPVTCAGVGLYTCFRLAVQHVYVANLLFAFLQLTPSGGVWIGRQRPPHRGAALLAGAIVIAALGPLVTHQQPIPLQFAEPLPDFLGRAASGLLRALLCHGPLHISVGVVESAAFEAALGLGLGPGTALASLNLATLLGLATGHVLLPVVGSAALLLLALLATGFAGWTLAGLAWPGAYRGPGAVAGVGLVLVGAVVLGVPGWELQWMQTLQRHEPHTNCCEGSCDVLHDRWTGHAYVQIVRRPGGGGVCGIYDNIEYWEAETSRYTKGGFDADYFVMDLLPPGGRLAVIGAGGGKQLQVALSSGLGLVLEAYELDPQVVEYFTEVNIDANAGVYVAPRVAVWTGESRQQLLAPPLAPALDGVYLADTGTYGGYLKTPLTETHFLHTKEAYQDYTARLAADGFVAASIMRVLDPSCRVRDGVAAGMQAAGLRVAVFQSPSFHVVLGTRNGTVNADRLRSLHRQARAAADQSTDEAEMGVDGPEGARPRPLRDLPYYLQDPFARAMALLAEHDVARVEVPDGLDGQLFTDAKGGSYVLSLFPEQSYWHLLEASIVLTLVLLPVGSLGAFLSAEPGGPKDRSSSPKGCRPRHWPWICPQPS